MFSRLRYKVSSLLKGKKQREQVYHSPLKQDIASALQELSLLAHDDSGSIELYIALANLYRVQGDVEKSLQIHARLLIRPDITHSVKARLYNELAKDYKNSGLLDRAIASYMQAKEFGYTEESLYYEMITIYDMLGDYEKAVLIAQEIKEPLLESYYVTKRYIQQNALIPITKQQVMKALNISPELTQSWVLLLCLYSDVELLHEFRSTFIKALNYIPVDFLLFELYLNSGTFQNISLEDKTAVVHTITTLVEEYESNFLLFYYLGLFYKRIEDRYHAIEYFEHSARLKEDFWATQYELFSLGVPSLDQDDIWRRPVQFFLEFGKNINRFFCSVCGLETNQSFSLCPRCNHIQTISFKTSL